MRARCLKNGGHRRLCTENHEYDIQQFVQARGVVGIHLPQPLDSQALLMRLLALIAIRAYQRVISPYKGFCCAYGFHTGHRSCSALGYRAIRSQGLLRGIALLQQRLDRCAIAYKRYRPSVSSRSSQRGVCDLGACAPSDLPAIDCAPADCDMAACAPSPCDCTSFWPSNPRREAGTARYIPPQRQKEHESNGSQ